MRPDAGVDHIELVKLDSNSSVIGFPSCKVNIKGMTLIRYREDAGEMHVKGKVIYEGGINERGTLRGKGKMSSHIGTFEERLIEGKWIGDGTSVRNATVQYLNQESTYTGDLKNMTRHGKGRVVHHSYGSIIDTNFVDGVMSGPFSAILSDGKAEGVTDGETLTGKRYIRAYSIMTPEEIASLGNPEWAIVREGVFDLPTLTLNGHGKVTYPNEDYYIGELKKDIQDGYGTVYSKTSGKLSGYIQGPRFVGKVRWEMTDGNVYEDELLDNKPHGLSTLTSPDGLVCIRIYVMMLMPIYFIS